MAKLLKLRRGTTSQHNSFTGAEGEVTVDTTKDTAVVHDGTTAGGRPLLREDLDNMPASGVTAGTYGNSTALPVITVDAKGLVTSATTSAIDSTAITNGTSNVSVAQNSNIDFVQGGTTQAIVTADGLKFRDGRKALFGNSNDLQIYHDGANSYIDDAGVGGIEIRGNQVKLAKYTGETLATFIADGESQLRWNNTIKLSTKDFGVDITGELQSDALDVDGPVNIDASKVTYDSSTGLKLADSVRLRFGAGNDLNIYHDTNNSYIKEEGDGELRLGSNNRVRITKHDSETCAVFDADGGAELYYDNALKFQTVSNGAKVTGRLEVTGDLNLAGELNLTEGADGGRVMDVRLGSSAFLLRGTSGGDANHEKLAKFNRNGGCELYHNDVKKFEVTSSGATVTGTLTAGTLQGDGVVPAGAILMWSGAQNAIPTGYVICDGNNGTPNLYNRFIVGAGSSYAVGATGGNSSTTLAETNLPAHTHGTGNHSHSVDAHSHSTPNHTHSVDAHSHSTPNHNHTLNDHSHNGSTNDPGNHHHTSPLWTQYSGRSSRPNAAIANVGKRDYQHNIQSTDQGGHTHNVSIDAAASTTNASGASNTGDAAGSTTSSGASNTGDAAPNTSAVSAGTTTATGSGTAIENRPPYYALCYIMKT